MLRKTLQASGIAVEKSLCKNTPFSARFAPLLVAGRCRLRIRCAVVEGSRIAQLLGHGRTLPRCARGVWTDQLDLRDAAHDGEARRHGYRV